MNLGPYTIPKYKYCQSNKYYWRTNVIATRLQYFPCDESYVERTMSCTCLLLETSLRAQTMQI